MSSLAFPLSGIDSRFTFIAAVVDGQIWLLLSVGVSSLWNLSIFYTLRRLPPLFYFLESLSSLSFGAKGFKHQ
jgi:hypothetical protein